MANAWYRLMIEYSRTGNEAIARDAVRVLRRVKPGEIDRLFNFLLSRIG
jgi:hypothetical protein